MKTLKQITRTLQVKCTDGKLRELYMEAIDEEGNIYITRDHGDTWESWAEIDDEAHYDFSGETIADIFNYSEYGETFEYEF